MLRPQRFETEIDPGPIQIQARKVHFEYTFERSWRQANPVIPRSDSTICATDSG
jgi:uncharacterized protein